MDTTVASAIEQTRNRLLPLVKLTLNTLAGACAAADLTVTLANQPTGITAGTFIAIENEVLYVSDTPTGNVVPVYRSQLGTTAPTSHASGSVVEAKTHFPRGLVFQAILEEVRALGPDLYRPVAITIDGASGVAGYDLGLMDWTEIHDVLRVYKRSSGSDYKARRLYFDFRRIGPADLCPTGTAALQLYGALPDDVVLDVTYAAPFDVSTFTPATDLVADCGLAPSMFDVVYLGAAYRLLQEAPRTQLATQAVPPKPEDVPAGLITSVRADSLREYSRRRNEEMQLLLRRYPR